MNNISYEGILHNMCIIVLYKGTCNKSILMMESEPSQITKLFMKTTDSFRTKLQESRVEKNSAIINSAEKKKFTSCAVSLK